MANNEQAERTATSVPSLEELWLHHTLTQALYREAALLDGRRFDEWLLDLTDDVTYQVPLVLNQDAQHMDTAVTTGMLPVNDDRRTLQLRVDRLKTGFAWAEDPPSRVRRYVTNIRIQASNRPDECQVMSDLLVMRNRDWDAQNEVITAERQDVWRVSAGRWQLARRFTCIDQVFWGTRNLGIFL